MRQILQMNQEQIDFHRLSYVQEESYQDQCRLDETASEGTEELQSIHMTKRQSIARTKPTDQTNATRDDRVKRRPEILVSI